MQCGPDGLHVRPLDEPFKGYTWRCEGMDDYGNYASALGHDADHARRRWQTKIDEMQYRAVQARIEAGRPLNWRK